MTDVQNILPAFRNKLKYIMESKNETPAERQALAFYLRVLEPYDDRILKKQKGFGKGIGGTGDNIVSMPVVERDENGAPIIHEGQLQTTTCMFDDFGAYLKHIECRQPVRHDTGLLDILPVSVNAIPRDDYAAIWFRQVEWCRGDLERS